MRIYYFLLEARPQPQNPERETCTGAFVNCWVSAKDPAQARRNAGALLNEEGWCIVRIEEQMTAERTWYLDDPELLSCFDTAVRSGCSAIFNTWEEKEPNDEEKRTL